MQEYPLREDISTRRRRRKRNGGKKRQSNSVNSSKEQSKKIDLREKGNECVHGEREREGRTGNLIKDEVRKKGKSCQVTLTRDEPEVGRYPTSPIAILKL